MKANVITTDPLETLRRCGGYYKCPTNSNGKRLGPLVGYAGKYQAPDGEQKQWVGDIYVNFAKAEEYPEVLQHFALLLQRWDFRQIDVFCGAPIGGYAFSQILGLVFGRKVIKAEKKILALAKESSREQSSIEFLRHSIEAGVRYAIVEDVCNNFSTTEKLLQKIHQLGGRVKALICFLNRSPNFEDYLPVDTDELEIPIKSLVRLPLAEYKQEDPFVAEDIGSGNVVWKPKDEWPRLMDTMAQK